MDCADCGRSFGSKRALWGHKASCNGEEPYPESELRELYNGQGLSTTEMAERLGLSRGNIIYHMDRHGIERRSISASRGGNDSYQDQSKLRRLYHDEGLSTYEMADEMDTTSATIIYWMDKFNIEREERKNRSPPSEKKPEKDELKRLYCEEHKSTIDLSERFGVAPGTISNWLRSYDLRVRTKAESLAQYVPDRGKLRELHWEEEMTLKEIADHFDANHGTVNGWFTRRDIPTRTYTGEEAARWQGGYERYYGPSWPEQRQKRLKMDGWSCVVCSLSNDEHIEKHGNGLHVHHIRPLRQFKEPEGVDYESANEIENLITLCQVCHNEWEGIPLRPET